MSAERHARIKKVFLAAREHPLEERDGLLARLCGGDEALRREVESLLLRVRDETAAAEDAVTADAPPSLRVASGQPPSIVNYRILQKIGEGGMGEVYEAEQQTPIRRRVALKVLKGGLETKEVIARFESERQALAMMSHPNIARVFEAGVSERERPFFAMELVHGEPITDYCDRHRLTTRERLNLFVDACAGVQHAHQKGIIHRDIKPSNVLVSVEGGKAVTKIIDFGVAKATTQRLTERTLFTELGQWIGTPVYMSPEQAEMSGLDIDTRTDIYSLGVLLYELLAGTPPLDSKELRQADLDEVRRRIREDEPTRPSTKVSGAGDGSELAARNRCADIHTLVQQLRGDLDWITLKALDKDRTRRYASPSEFAADIRRHLDDEPVLARPPRTRYKIGKFIRRNRLTVVAASLVAGALILGLVGTGFALGRAKYEARRANQVASFLEKLLGDVSPFTERTAASTEVMLERAVVRMETELEGQELVQARMMNRIGISYRDLGLFESARAMFERSLQILQAEFGREHVDVATLLNELGLLAWEAGDYLHARHFFEEGLEIKKRFLDTDDPRVADAEMEVAFSLWALGDFDRAEALFTRSLATQERVYGAEHLVVSRNLLLQGVLFNSSGDYRRARTVLERSLKIRTESFGSDHIHVGWVVRTLARAQLLQGAYEQALESARHALEIMESSLGPNHTDLAFTLSTLGSIHRELGQFEQARPLLERSLTLREEGLGPNHAEVGLSLTKMGWLYLDAKDPETAGPLIERAIAVGRLQLPPGHPQMGWRLHALSRQRLLSGRWQEALDLQREALAIIETARGTEHPALATHLANLGVVLREMGDHDAARPLLERALGLHEKQLGPMHRLVADDRYELAVLHSLTGETHLASREFDRALAVYETAVGNHHPAVALCLRAYAEHLQKTGNDYEARRADHRASEIEGRVSMPGPRS